METNLSIVFSGRFDPPHPGHIASIIRLTKTFQKVVVVVLDYPERDYPLIYCLEVLRECLEDRPVFILSNKTHFGKLTHEEWVSFACDYYGTGNLEVLKHMEKIGVPTCYVERSFDYAASKYERLTK